MVLSSQPTPQTSERDEQNKILDLHSQRLHKKIKVTKVNMEGNYRGKAGDWVGKDRADKMATKGQVKVFCQVNWWQPMEALERLDWDKKLKKRIVANRRRGERGNGDWGTGILEEWNVLCEWNHCYHLFVHRLTENSMECFGQCKREKGLMSTKKRWERWKTLNSDGFRV